MAGYLSDEPCMALVDPAQLQQVLLDLASNAQDAMPSGGKFTLEVGRREVDEESCKEILDVQPGQFGELTVSDGGEGGTSTTRSQVFQPS